jgi:hypothetical protein
MHLVQTLMSPNQQDTRGKGNVSVKALELRGIPCRLQLKGMAQLGCLYTIAQNCAAWTVYMIHSQMRHLYRPAGSQASRHKAGKDFKQTCV